jgi:hypothetical protein
MQRLILLGISLLLSISLFNHNSRASVTPTVTEGPQNAQSQPTAENDASSVIYQNIRYGFNFSLPDSWKSYTIVTDQWAGTAIGDVQTVATGPLLSIRHPEWTIQNPCQDIPIMVFTLAQWNSLQQDEFHIGAAPINPSELGRNNKYVFALPARYNFAFATGYEEVEQILNGKPLQPFNLPN